MEGLVLNLAPYVLTKTSPILPGPPRLLQGDYAHCHCLGLHFAHSHKAHVSCQRVAYSEMPPSDLHP